MEEDGERVWDEFVVVGVHEEELGTEDDIAVQRGAKQASMEVAEVSEVRGRMEKGEVEGDESWPRLWVLRKMRGEFTEENLRSQRKSCVHCSYPLQ